MSDLPASRAPHVGEVDLKARYGGPKPWQRAVWIVLTTTLATVGIVWLIWTAWFHSTPGVEAGLISFTIDSDRQVTATYDTLVRDNSTGTCLLRASATDHAVVGEANVPVTTTGRESFSFRTERRATAVELVSCSTK
ncbi:MAG TPA: DUF4307 domain-containing protein [Marmoricola sp.]|nr:DUF4307 domain-containing protein [Marmoricola sp.]